MLPLLKLLLARPWYCPTALLHWCVRHLEQPYATGQDCALYCTEVVMKHLLIFIIFSKDVYKVQLGAKTSKKHSQA